MSPSLNHTQADGLIKTCDVLHESKPVDHMTDWVLNKECICCFNLLILRQSEIEDEQGIMHTQSNLSVTSQYTTRTEVCGQLCRQN